ERTRWMDVAGTGNSAWRLVHAGNWRSGCSDSHRQSISRNIAQDRQETGILARWGCRPEAFCSLQAGERALRRQSSLHCARSSGRRWADAGQQHGGR
ncbi:hypothetical protein T310_8894, partial [Rasamsonia emersonii CBS 393.64]